MAQPGDRFLVMQRKSAERQQEIAFEAHELQGPQPVEYPEESAPLRNVVDDKAVAAITHAERTNGKLRAYQTCVATATPRPELANLCDLWDMVPRFVFSQPPGKKTAQPEPGVQEHPAPVSMSRAGPKAGQQVARCEVHLPTVSREFSHRGVRYRIRISPARVVVVDNPKEFVEREFYPGESEEIVEDALRKLAMDQGFHGPGRTGVQFTIYALRKELKDRGHTRSYQQIVQSLHILAKSQITIEAVAGGSPFSCTSSYLPTLAVANRSMLSENPSARWVAQFHPLVNQAIDEFTYRQYHYTRLMGLPRLARWLYRLLVLKYTAASNRQSFTLHYSTVEQNSFLLDYREARKGVKALDEALAVLQRAGVLDKVEKTTIAGPRKQIVDVKYTLRASKSFVEETITANRAEKIRPRLSAEKSP